MYVELVQSNASDELAARAAWVSNVGEESKTKDASAIQGLINFLYRNHHSSPFEHGQYTFFIKCPIFVAREFFRHRTFSFNEVSGRYSEMLPLFYSPGKDRPVVQKGKIGNYEFDEAADKLFIAQESSLFATDYAWKHYIHQKNEGIANEVARDVLPLSLYTSFYASVNPRNLMHFLNLRTDPQALFEIRDVADQMAEYLEDQQPLVYNAWVRYKNRMIDTEKETVVDQNYLETLEEVYRNRF